MYLTHWGLESSPFTLSFDEPYPTAPLTEATARADYLISHGRRVGVLLGARGLGKTTALASIAAEQSRKGTQVARLDAVALTARELLWRVAEGLGTSPDPADTQMLLWRRIEDHLAENRWQSRPTVLLVDDASELGPDSQQQLARLARLEQNAASRWTLLLAMSDDTLETLNQSLLHLIDLRIDLTAWTEEDTVGYVQSALVDAGRFDPIFTDDALEHLHRCAQGAPRHIVRLADFALLVGANQKADAIDANLIEHAFNETSWTPKTVTLASSSG